MIINFQKDDFLVKAAIKQQKENDGLKKKIKTTAVFSINFIFNIVESSIKVKILIKNKIEENNDVLLDSRMLYNFNLYKGHDLLIQMKICFLPLNNLFNIQMITSQQLDEDLSDSKILKEIKNILVASKQNQTQTKKTETGQEIQQIKNKNKHKTVPLSLLNKQQKIAQFEKLIYSNVSQLIKKTFIIELYRGVKYSLKSLKGPSQIAISQKQVKLKENTENKLKFLFLDLDQTLIFTQREKPSLKSKSNEISFKIHIRPYTNQFLSNISKYYNIYIFTAASKQYAEAVINKLNFSNNFIQDFLCRNDCFQTKRGKVIKDLRIVQNRTLKDIILVDNKAQSFGLQIDNGIPILEFYGARDDVELQHLEKVLIDISKLDDVRKGIAAHFRLKQLAMSTKEELQQYLKRGRSLGNSQKILFQDYKS